MESHGIQTFLRKRSVPKKSLARTCFLAKKQCAPPKAALQIRLEKWGEISGTRFAGPTFRLPKSRLVRLWCVYFTKSEPIFKIGNVSHARSAWWLEIKPYAPRKPRNRLA